MPCDTLHRLNASNRRIGVFYRFFVVWRRSMLPIRYFLRHNRLVPGRRQPVGRTPHLSRFLPVHRAADRQGFREMAYRCLVAGQYRRQLRQDALQHQFLPVASPEIAPLVHSFSPSPFARSSALENKPICRCPRQALLLEEAPTICRLDLGLRALSSVRTGVRPAPRDLTDLVLARFRRAFTSVWRFFPQPGRYLLLISASTCIRAVRRTGRGCHHANTFDCGNLFLHCLPPHSFP